MKLAVVVLLLFHDVPRFVYAIMCFYRYFLPIIKEKENKASGLYLSLGKILQKCLRLGIALKTPLCYNIHSGQ